MKKLKMKIITAFIEQTIEFSNQSELDEYVKRMNGKPFKIVATMPYDDGSVMVKIRKGYNNNKFPD